MFSIPVFSSWRLVWNQNENTKNLGDVADSLAQRRNHLLAGSGEVRDLQRFAPRLRAFRFLRQERAEQLKEKDPGFLYHSYVSGIAELTPILEAARWGRWLLLEEALGDAMQYGDLLFGALALRTQIEDLGTLLRLEQIERQVQDETAMRSDAFMPGADVSAIEEIVDFLWERFLPRFESPTTEEMGARKRNTPVIQLPNELYGSVTALNDYVHPNYGSHMAAIFPETSALGKILLTAFNAVYDTFFNLDFVKQSPIRPVHGALNSPVSYVKVQRRFIERTLPRLTRVLQKTRGYPEEWAPQPFRIFTDRLKRETNQDGITADSLLQLDNGPEHQNRLQEKRSTLRSLCSAVVPDREWSTEEILRFAEKHTVPTVALNTVMWVMLAHMRDLGHRLEVEAKQLPVEVLFPRQPPFDRWIGFTRDAIQLAVLATHRKIELMRFAAVRMINQRNSLGAILCARSLLEHYAVAKTLAERFNSDVKSIEEEARSGRDVVARFDRLEQDIGDSSSVRWRLLNSRRNGRNVGTGLASRRS